MDVWPRFEPLLIYDAYPLLVRQMDFTTNQPLDRRIKAASIRKYGKAGNTTGGKSSVFLSDTVAWNST
jgi:hypothetical protein